MKRTVVTTESGSRYTVAERDDGAYFLEADNRPNPDSRSYAGELWPIQRPSPWPPVIGFSLTLLCVHYTDLDHEERIPGGGKVTSRVADYFDD